MAAGPYLIGRAIDQAISHGDRAGLAPLMVALFVIYLVGFIASSGSSA